MPTKAAIYFPHKTLTIRFCVIEREVLSDFNLKLIHDMSILATNDTTFPYLQSTQGKCGIQNSP